MATILMCIKMNMKLAVLPDDLAVQIKEAMAGKRDPKTIDGKQSDSYMLLEEDQAKGVFGTKNKR